MSVPADVTQALSRLVHGPVFGPDEDWVAELSPFNTRPAHAPEVVVAATTGDDVVATVRFARETGRKVSVLATGHGEGTVTGGILLSTQALRRLDVDPRTGVARLGAGLTWGEVTEAAVPHGYFPVGGAAPGVGLVGYLLGGGLGPLARSHGFSSDHVVSLTVVTGAGELVEANARSHPDLFWALRGGKHGLGVVTELDLRLVPEPRLYAGSLTFAGEHAEDVLRGWVDWTATADPAVTTSVALVTMPPFESVPEPLRGKKLVSLRFAYPGSPGEGALLAEPLRALAPIVSDDLAELAATDVGRIHDDPPGPAAVWTGGYMLTHADQELVSTLLRLSGPAVETPWVATEIRHLGAATRREPDDGSAVTGRDAGFTLGWVGVAPPLFEAMPGTYAGYQDELRPWLAPQTNPNFAGELGDDHTSWSEETLERLRAIRHRYDPDGVFG